MTRRIAHAAQIGLLLVLVLVPVALAAKGGHNPSGGSGSSSLSLATPLVYDANGDGLPNWGDQVTFKVSTTATSRPFVALNCFQGGVRVYGFSAGIFPTYAWTQTYTLKSSMWTGGSANCTATGYYFTSNGRENVFATMSFTVGA
jgi:hypothetical protein